MRHWLVVRSCPPALAGALLLAALLAPAPAWGHRPRAEHRVTLGDFVLRYELAVRIRDRRGKTQLEFDATLENTSNVDVGAVLVEARSRLRNGDLARSRVWFPALPSGARVSSTHRLRIVEGPGRHAYATELRFAIENAAPVLTTSAPADGAGGVPPSEWIVMSFERAPARSARRGFALACNGAALPIAVDRLAGDRLVLNPTPQLPGSSSCTLGWVGPSARATELAFETGVSESGASVRYDRSDTSKSNPLPDDFFTTADASTPTGLRVQIPVPTADGGTRLIVGTMLPEANMLDGFSPHGPIVLELSEPPDPQSLPESPEASLDPFSPIALLDLTPGSPQHGERVPFATHFRSDRIANGPVEHVLFVYPATQLRRGGRYGLVISRRLRSESLRYFGPSPYSSAALADPAPGEAPSLAKLRPLVREVAVAAEALELPIPADDLAFVLRFSVGSLSNVFETPLAMREQVESRPPPAVTITHVARSFQNGVLIVEGLFDAPYWTDAFGVLVRDGRGRPVIQGEDSIPFVLALPSSATEARAPPVLYQHGWPGTSAEVGQQAEQELARAGFAVAGFTDSLNRAYGPDLGAQSVGIYLTLLRTRQLPGFWMETLGQQLAFLRALQELGGDLDVLPLGAPDGVPDLDPSKLFYAGVSGGATQGAMLLPYAPEIAAAHLAVGSGRLVETAVHQESPEGSRVLRSLGAAFPLVRPSELWSSLHLFQMIFDWQEAQTHAARLYRDPIEVDGTTRKASILWAEGLNDSQSPPTARRAAIHGIGLPLLEPVRDAVPLLRVEPTPVSANIDEATTGGAFQYVPAGVPGIAPTPGCEREFEGHFCASGAEAAWLQRAAFFASALSGPPSIESPFSDLDQDGLPDLDETFRGTDPEHPDSDRDGMPDGFEVRNFLDPRDVEDAGLDPDDDGLTNRDEYESGTSIHDRDTDRDGLSDGAERNLYGTSPTLADTDGGGRSDGEEVNRDHTDPNVGADDLPLRALPARLTDGAGFRWTVMPHGGVPYGDCCEEDDDALDLWVGLSPFPSFEYARVDDARELVIGPAELAGLRVTRKVFVSPSEGFLRHLVIVENPMGTDTTASVRLTGRFHDTTAETSSGDDQIDPTDDWVRSEGNEDHVIAFVFSDALAEIQPAAPYRFDVPIRAGGRAILLAFHSRRDTAEDAHAAIERILARGENLFEGMTPEERAEVVNFLD